MRLPPGLIDPDGAGDGDGLYYNAATGEFEPGPPPAGSGGITGLTSADATVTISDNGDGTLDLSAPGSGGGGGSTTYHGCCANRTTTQSIANGTAFQFNAADSWDTDAIHDPATNNTRFTIPAGLGGIWTFRTIVSWSASSLGRGYSWGVNGTGAVDAYRCYVAPASSTSLYQHSVVDILLNAGDYVECIAVIGSSTSISGARVSCQFLGAP